MNLIEDGKLTIFWLLDLNSARQLGMQPTGHGAWGAGRPPATSPRERSGVLKSLIGGIRRGLFISDLIGFGVNGVTGDSSRARRGLIEKAAVPCR